MNYVILLVAFQYRSPKVSPKFTLILLKQRTDNSYKYEYFYDWNMEFRLIIFYPFLRYPGR